MYAPVYLKQIVELTKLLLVYNLFSLKILILYKKKLFKS